MCSSEVLDLQAVLCWCNPRDLWVFWNKNGQKKESVYLCAWSGYYWGCDAPISCSNIELQDHFMHHVLTLGRDKDSLTLCFSNQCPSFSSKRFLFFHSSSVFHLFGLFISWLWGLQGWMHLTMVMHELCWVWSFWDTQHYKKTISAGRRPWWSPTSSSSTSCSMKALVLLLSVFWDKISYI